ncbi:hypothetical protein PEBR_41599 [Penicillium brasilianum]|uniref:Zn(2)-C6 fungal-type domain-containing protein n=1 Tax=Penicillium brasilianum TaxID=104259 RepID=A0A1S9R9B7_PENBI|nr:hypothetical protein PEBR_41599 [Penicillium brasilianum]
MTGGQRQRRSMPKVRTGCATCKARRIKCDETRPGCQRCTRTGRICPGYRSDTLLRPTINDAIKIYSLPFKVPGSKADRELLHFYCCEASETLSRFSDTTLWTHLVLQQSQHQPVIRHALVALSSLYRDYLQVGSQQLKMSPQHIQLIVRSHKQLSTHLVFQDASPETALICSIIFYVFECLVGNSQQAIWHLDQGLALLQSLWNSKASLDVGFDGMHRQLRMIFTRLDIHTSLFIMGRAPVLDLVSPQQLSGQAHVVPELFTCLAHAEEALLALQSWTLRHLHFYVAFKGVPQDRLPPQALSERLQIKDELRRLEIAIADLATGVNAHSFTPAQHQQLTLIDIQARVFYAVVLEYIIQHTNSEVASRLNFAMDQITHILSTGGRKDDSGLYRDFTLSSNIIALLYFICMKTHDRRVLDRALSLMQNHLASARDGLWDSSMAVTIVKAVQEKSGQDDGPKMALSLEYVDDRVVDADGGLDGAFRTLQITEQSC